ncbi:helix-turn-helix domain-containing protein [Enterococcus sp. 5H]|uniref:helix-turn-helix domain-containing protein n=1 Tax=Enterococcus sp. 5H TaxID=1229490 RepID=UPI002302365D|nr:helix-turn-helix transcriptional regulator [Enterococcus sp. 5H]MDA9470948.1 Transcriptional regulator, XRE family [Enterococcus sp. 5H]
MEIDLIEAGKRISQIRKKHKYSMASFATLIGNSSASTVNNWEKGNNLPKQERLKKIAILGNTTADWIRYGDFDTYVQQLLVSATLPLTSEQFEQLLKTLKKEKISYRQDLKILTTVHDLFPNLVEQRYQLDASNPRELLISEDSTEYTIEKDDRYRSDFLPVIEELLQNSNNKTINEVVLFQLFDMLRRSEANTQFPLITKIIAILSEILTNDIVYPSCSNSKIVNYTELVKEKPKRKPLAEKTVQKKYHDSKTELIHLLDEFYSEYNNSSL